MLFSDTVLVGEKDEKILLGEQVRIWNWLLLSAWRHYSNSCQLFTISRETRLFETYLKVSYKHTVRLLNPI
jgi:hypothetical protein